MAQNEQSQPGDGAVQPAPQVDARYIGLVTRAVSWGIDEVLLNLVAIFTGLGVALIVAIFPITKNLKPAFEIIAGAVYVLWTATYFVAFWSSTGQTPGARVLQIRLITAKHQKVKIPRAIVRWIGMNLALIPLGAGYLPILFGRRGFPDYLAKTLVVNAPQTSLAQMRLATLRAAARQGGATPASRPGEVTESAAQPGRPPV
jgi:uncharacterized RDD family membrane protein YckC